MPQEQCYLTQNKSSFRYIRLSDATPMEKVKTLLLDYWNIFKPNRPHLALSLVGGAKNFRLEGRKKETFKVRYLICVTHIIHTSYN